MNNDPEQEINYDLAGFLIAPYFLYKRGYNALWIMKD